MDSAELKNYLIKTLCRICAKKSSKLMPIMEIKLLPLKIYKCLPIKVTAEDDLPISICEGCLLKINETYMFYESCYYADQRLKNIWKTLVNNSVENSVDVPISKEHKNNDEEAVEGNYLYNNYTEECNKRGSDNMLLVVDAEILDETFSNDLGKNKINDILIPSNIVINISEDLEYNTVNCIESDRIYLSSLRGEVEPDNGENVTEEAEVITSIPVTDCSSENNIQLVADPEKSLCSTTSFIVKEPIHSQEKPFLCDTCGKSFKSANNLKSHVIIHSENRKKFHCKICGKTFFTKFFLQEHMNTHTGETPYKCLQCGKEFKERVHLRQHKWTHSTQKFLCPVCGSNFNRKGNMTEHIKKYHSNNDEVKGNMKKVQTDCGTSIESKFHCTLCSKNFPSQSILKSHNRSHVKKQIYFCSLCGKQFRHSGSLTYHRRAAHTGEKPFQCTYCEERFSLRSVQRIHERKKHTFEYPYKCSECFKIFNNSSSLKNHSYVHIKEKMFECDVCGKKFSRNSNLFVHKKIHSDDRQYTCEQCGKSYIQKYDMIKHMKVHDPKSKPFFCKYCGNSFSQKKDFAKHAMCHFEYIRKKSNSDIVSAEKILDAFTGSFQKNSKTLIDAEQFILGSSFKITKEDVQSNISK